MGKELLEVHSLPGLDHQHLADHILSEGVNFIGEGNGFFVTLEDGLLGEGGLVLEDGVLAEEHLIGDDAQTPDIALLVILFSIEDLGSHGGSRPHKGAEVLLLLEFGKPEISQFNLQILGNQNVVEFQVSVHHLVFLDFNEGVLELH